MHRTLAITAAALLFAGAAHAQSSAPSSTGAQSTSSSTQSATSPGATSTSSDRARAMSQDKVRHALSQAGFQEVRIIDAAYLVQAKTKDGDPVVMILNPPSMDATAATGSTRPAGAASPAGGAGASGSGTATGSSSTGSKQ